MLLFRSGHFANWGWFGWLLSILLSILISASQVFAQSKGHKKKQSPFTARPATSTSEQSLTNILLLIGYEAKGLVLPDLYGKDIQRGRIDEVTTHRFEERLDG